ncbi:MAG: hypothetical protein JNN03_00805 [Rubrivivax sp.]|nr:hypothetical protein [Rubrivivax sp.]
MLGIATRYWNEAAQNAVHPAWRRLFAMSTEEMALERDRLREGMISEGRTGKAVLAYLETAPLHHECLAVEVLQQRHWQLREGLCAVPTAQEALLIAQGDFRLTRPEVQELALMLACEPEDVLLPVPTDVQSEAWTEELEAVEYFSAGDYSVADSAEVPDELLVHEPALEADQTFEESFERWFFEMCSFPPAAIVLEQCCADGLLVDAARRGRRLAGAPDDLRSQVEAFLAKVPTHVAAHVAHTCYWLVRSERGRRCGRPDWSPLFPMPTNLTARERPQSNA